VPAQRARLALADGGDGTVRPQSVPGIVKLRRSAVEAAVPQAARAGHPRRRGVGRTRPVRERFAAHEDYQREPVAVLTGFAAEVVAHLARRDHDPVPKRVGCDELAALAGGAVHLGFAVCVQRDVKERDTSVRAVIHERGGG
jgi:hypothetical protein